MPTDANVVRLYSFQRPRFDVTRPTRRVLSHCKPGGRDWEILQCLGWKECMFAHRFRDYYAQECLVNDPRAAARIREKLQPARILLGLTGRMGKDKTEWVLEVPQERVKWLDVFLLVDDGKPASECILEEAPEERYVEALLERPVDPAWVVRRTDRHVMGLAHPRALLKFYPEEASYISWEH